MKRYYFRVDGGNIYSVATGHITRCLKLAEYITAQEQAKICFVMKDFAEGVNIVKNKFDVISIAKNADRKEEISILRKTMDPGSCFICDLRNIDDNYISEVKKICAAFILFDDLGVKNIHPDILINPTPFSYYDYKENDYPGTDLLFGENFFFTRDKLINNSYPRDFKKDKYSIMTSFGGADPLNITEFFIKNIAPKLKQHDISIVLGPAYAKKEELIKKYKDSDDLHFSTDVFPLDDMLLNHDVVFVCGGDTSIEACRSGAATFIISSIDYEKDFGRLLHNKEMAYFVADIEDIKAGRFTHDYMTVLEDRSKLAQLSRKGVTLTDGKGLERIYQFILKKEHRR